MSTVIIHDFVPYVPPAFIPTPTEEDNGKYVGVSEGVYDLSYVDALPSVTSSDNGKFLGVKYAEWDKVDSPIPSLTSSDNGKFLGIQNSKIIKARPVPNGSINGQILKWSGSSWSTSKPFSAEGIVQISDNNIVSMPDGRSTCDAIKNGISFGSVNVVDNRTTSDRENYVAIFYGSTEYTDNSETIVLYHWKMLTQGGTEKTLTFNYKTQTWSFT